jgi:hypothetical protein
MLVGHPKPQHPVVLDERRAIKMKKGETITQVLEHFFSHVHPSSVCPSALCDHLLTSMNGGK